MKLSFLSWFPAIDTKSAEQPISFIRITAILAIAFALSGCNESGLTEISESPAVRSTVPGNEETDIAINTSVGATFDRQMDPSSISDSSFQVFQDTATVAGSIDYTDSTVTFTPFRNFEENTRIIVRISGDVADIDGNTMDSEYEWSFTTGGRTTASAPRIMETNPANGTTGIPVNTAVVATFGDTMDASTINTATFLLRQQATSTNVAGAVDYSGMTAVFTPSGNLQNGQRYRATITDNVRSMDGNPLGESYGWQFTTAEEDIDDEPPEISATNPRNDENDVPVNATVSATFTEEMDAATISAETFTLSASGSSVKGSIEYSNNRAEFNPFSNMDHSMTYTAHISTGARDQAGNSLEEPYRWSFTIEAAPDNTPPEVVDTNPRNDEDDVSRNVTITAEFNEPLDPATVSGETVILERQRFLRGPREVKATISYSDNIISIDPESKLRKEEDYTARLITGITDVAGNALNRDYEWEFETDDD